MKKLMNIIGSIMSSPDTVYSNGRAHINPDLFYLLEADYNSRKRTISKKDIEYTIELLDEYERPEDAFCNSDDPELDKVACAEIRWALAAGNAWAWCCVRVVATDKNGNQGHDVIGCCSYRNESDFISDGYYDDLKDRALADLIERMEAQGLVISLTD